LPAAEVQLPTPFLPLPLAVLLLTNSNSLFERLSMPPSASAWLPRRRASKKLAGKPPNMFKASELIKLLATWAPLSS
jgi:hypothetical protein